MKLLHIYAGNLFGGIETLLLTLAKQQSLCAQLQSQFALCFEGRLSRELRNLDAQVHLLGKVKISHPWTVWKARLKLRKILEQQQFDVVICHACWSQAIFGSVAKANRVPLVFWCHDVPNGQHPLERLAKLTIPDLVIANSRHTQAAVPKLYPQANSDILLHPVVFPDIGNDPLLVRRAVRTELNTPDDAVVIIQASRLERWKGQSMLLSALGQLRAVSNWVCWLAGGVQRSHEAEYLQELKIQARELGIAERVRFLGQRTDVGRLLVAADIYCQPNTLPEPFGIAFVEALYAGLPVIATAMGGGAEIVDDSCGRLVAANDINGLSKALDDLISHTATRATLASASKARAEFLCNPQKQLNQLYCLLDRVVERETVV
jgi:glycosyltransferase involved in cell wall biosynthesis